jgi:alpha-galactosidase
MIGAGSLIFTKTLSMDILATEALAGSELCLMDLDKGKLKRIEGFVQRVIDENGKPAKVWSTTDRR